MKTFTKIAIALALLVLAGFTPLAQGQTALSTTTLGAAVSTSTCSDATFTVASTSTMAGLGTLNQPNTVYYVDKEYGWVKSVTDSTHFVGQRCKGVGAGAVPRTHLSGSIVYFANTSGTTYAATIGFKNEQPNAEVSGTCTATNIIGLPVIYLWSGDRFDCLGGQWVQTDRPGVPVLASATVTIPAGVLTPTGTVMITDTGTNAMTGITVPNGWGVGNCLQIVPGGAFTWTTATNIAASGTAVAAKVTFFCWDGAKWAANI